MEALLNFVKEQAAGGMVALAWFEGSWTVAVTWGNETENAAYGVGETLEEAVAAARKDIEG